MIGAYSEGVGTGVAQDANKKNTDVDFFRLKIKYSWLVTLSYSETF